MEYINQKSMSSVRSPDIRLFMAYTPSPHGFVKANGPKGL